MRKIIALMLLSICPYSWGTTYYISSSTGSDTNVGTDKAHPWAHVKGMVGASSNASAHTPVGDDVFIFMGCDQFTGVFPLGVTWSGTSGHPITYTVDKTWYNTTNCPSGWNRPVFNANGAVMATNNNFVRMTGGAGGFTTWDNIEFTGYVWNSGSFGQVAFFCTGNCSGGSVTNIGITNNYFHNWRRGPNWAAGTSYPSTSIVVPNTGNAGAHRYSSSGGTSGGTPPTWCQTTSCTVNDNGITWTESGTVSDSLYVLLGNTNSPNNANSVVSNNVFDNTDGDQVSGAVMYAWSGTITNNIIRNVSNGILPFGPGGEIGMNNVGPINTSFDPSVHENCIETLGGASPVWYIHDNNCHDGQAGEAMMVGNNGETDYVWNNVIWNWSGNAPHFAQTSGQSITALHFRNNTIVPVASGNCFIEVFSPTIGILDIQNNQCITTASNIATAITGVTTLIGINTSGANTTGTNLLQTPTAAAAQGYTASQSPYVYYPTPGGSTIGAGTNLSSGWPGGFTTNDSSYACTEATISGVIQASCPARTSNTRGSTWDIGAFQSGGAATAPSCQPLGGPVPQTLTCTNPNTGTTVMCYRTDGVNPTTALDGVNCGAGSTKYTTALSISSPETVNIVAGTSIGSDSNIVTLTFVTGVAPSIGLFAQSQILTTGQVNVK